MTTIYKIKWVVAHDPLYLFLRAAEDFKAEVNTRCKDYKIDVEIMTPTQYAERYNAGKYVPRQELFNLMHSGAVQMSQMVTTTLAARFNKQMHVLDMPFLFEDHDHATEVLEGKVGEYLLNSFSPESKVKGLAFTYSGGFRCVPTNQDVSSLADLVNQPIRTGMNPMAVETFRAIGATPVQMELEEINQGVAEGRVVGGESAFPRIYPCNQNEFSKTVLDTGHSLFLTSIIVSTDWWNTLPTELREIIADSAIAAGRAERRKSIEDGEDTKVKLAAEGVKVVTLSDAEKAEFKAKTQSVYDKFADFFKPGLVEDIRRAH
jgi:TRAP-type C4-dicarboxylate transport system substrate-binding protein